MCPVMGNTISMLLSKTNTLSRTVGRAKIARKNGLLVQG